LSRTLTALASVFAPLSIVTVGGGQAIIADIQRQVVEVHHWMTQAQFVNDFAIARLAPCPGSLLATLIGWQVAGIAGALIATFALFGPTALLMYGIAHLWNKHRGARWQNALQAGLRPVAAGLILAAVYVLVKGLEGGWIAWGSSLVATAIVTVTRIKALIVIAGTAMFFVLLHLGGAL
jgi:chromate transporter